MNVNVETLCCLLATYEADDPHVFSPDLDVGKEEDQYYPVVTNDEFSKWLRSEHCGHCLNLPSVCVRCHAEYILHKAKWIISQLKNDDRR